MRITRNRIAAAVLCVAALHGGVLNAQTPQQPAQAGSTPLEIGAVAPDFELPAATRYGILRDHVRLSDFKGKTVVLAFFFKARTKG